MGGDEFVLLLPATDARGAAHVAQKLLRLTREVSQAELGDLPITASIGIALYPADGSDFDTLVKRADAAMYRAKQNGRNGFCFHTVEIQARSERILLIENGLRHALDKQQMQLYFQPQTSLRNGALVGAEALLRWQHPDLGWVSPAEFIPIAERSGQIGTIGEWVIRTAVRQMKLWRDGGLAPIVVAVNLSPMQFRQPALAKMVNRILEESAVDPSYLELELTESVASEDPVGASTIMEELRAGGVRISIDDFGTGYSSLAYLKRFKVYKLKIDQSFISNLTTDLEDQAIVKAIIHLAASLGMSTIAEGVETTEQMEYLRTQECDEIQGYLISRPLPVAEFAEFQRRHRARLQ
jgi:EAL domain-containing protein (putative c-di-GMP-specific phosphodiesterase class I)